MIIAVIGQNGYPTKRESLERLKQVLIDLVQKHTDSVFYFAYLDGYSKLCNGIIKELQGEYPQVKRVFIAPYEEYVPRQYGYDDFDEIITPEPCRMASRDRCINLRNKWIIENSDARLCFFTFELDRKHIYHKHELTINGESINLGTK